MTPVQHRFVLVHGAWHGAWCWDAVADLLRAQGHTVTTPTQTGLGERRHLLHTRPDLGTFIEDIVQHIDEIGGNDVVLVGHSFAGMVISGVADRISGRLQRLIYLDSGVVEGGIAAIGRLSAEARRARLEHGQKEHGGLAFSPPAVSLFGITDRTQQEKVAARLSPQPMGSYTTPLELAHPLGNGLPADYILCTDPQYQNEKVIADWLKAHGWPLHRLATGHDAMLTDAKATAEQILGIANGNYSG